jgi:hypothetical protein
MKASYFNIAEIANEVHKHSQVEQTRFVYSKMADCYLQSRAVFVSIDFIKTLVTEQGPLADHHTDRLDLPFKIVWFESLDSQLYDLMKDNEVMRIDWMMVHELSPGEYEFFVGGGPPDHKEKIDKEFKEIEASNISEAEKKIKFQQVNEFAMRAQLSRITKSEQVGYNNVLALVGHLLGAINKAEMGTVTYGGSVKVPTSNGRQFKKIRNVIICGKKKDVESHAAREFNKEVNWSHQWEVRGHWRKCATVGKDREGNYCVSNFTWVKNHVKGEGLLVKKVRIFKNDEVQT